ncbi:MAG TPA: hypothetical protein VGZ72_01245 [Stellaceae bacterium]|jgi:hypothetical protein|nr:hypothetical protein [Stellaceae bacterium]
MRSLSLSLTIAALSLLPAVASAAPATMPSMPAGDPSALLAQGGPPPGWWEQEGRPDDLRDRYWHLPPRERFRYDQLEAQIRDLQARQEQARREQRRILRWGG